MRKEHWISYLLFFLFMFCIFTSCNKKTLQDTVEIYPVKYMKFEDLINIKDIDKIKLDEHPIITQDEIIKYNWKQQIIRIKNNDLSIPPGEGLPFVLIVNNERIYLGALWTPLSSVRPPEIPIISMYAAAGKEYIDVSLGYNKDNNEIQKKIKDKRIYKALKNLRKLE